jgi:hypothetical protein
MTKKNDRANGEAKADIDLPDIAEDPVKAKLASETEATQRDVDRLNAVESELSALRGQIQELERKRATYAAALEAAIAERRAYAFDAAKGDPAAVERLRSARAVQTEAALILEDQDSAIAEGRRQFDALELERDGLAPSGPWHDAMVLAKDLLGEDGEKIDFHIAGLIEVLSGHQQKLEALKALARDAGRERAFGNCGTRQVMRVFSTRMAAIWPLEYEKFSSVYQKNSYGQILKMQVANSIGVSLDVESNGETSEPTTAVESNEANAAV